MSRGRLHGGRRLLDTRWKAWSLRRDSSVVISTSRAWNDVNWTGRAHVLVLWDGDDGRLGGRNARVAREG